MKIKFSIRGLLHGAIAALAIFMSQSTFAEEPWVLTKESEGIKVYTRNVPNSPLREFKGEIELGTSPETVVKVLKDAGSFRKWMPDVVVSELLSSTDKDQYHYLENSAPWPVSNRDGVYHFVYSRSDEVGAVVTTVNVEAAPNYAPRREGKVRIPKSDGFWKIVPIGNGVSISYQIHADPGGSIPGWMANASVVDTPFKTLKNLRNYIQQDR